MNNLLTPIDVAEILGVSYETALSFIKYSGIDYVRIGRQYRVSESKLKAFTEKKGKTSVNISEF